MIAEEGGRAVIHCDRCPIRLDLGPSAVVKQHLRMPSAWVQDGPDHHLCPTCAQKVLRELAAARH